ncbi:hypothetical protein GN956_G24737 [Arapaima gigas]
MAAMSEETRVGYKAVAELLEKLTDEARKLEENQEKLVKHNHTLSTLNKSFNQVQSRLEKVAAVKWSSHLLNQ